MNPPERLRAHFQACVGRLKLDVELDSGPGTLVVIGPNGAGKTTLLTLLLGARPVERGRIGVGDTVLVDTARSIDVPVEQRRVGYVPQDYALFPHMNVRQNVEFALTGQIRLPPAARRARARSFLDELGIGALAERRVRTLSGGEKQRVALARALSARPRALLLDEPLAALDIHARRDVRAFLAEYLRKLALPTVLVTHDHEDARTLGHRIVVLEGGTVTGAGTWEELSRRPTSAFVEAFVSGASRR